MIAYYTGAVISSSQVAVSSSRYLLSNPITREVVDAAAPDSGYAGKANDALNDDSDNARLTTQRSLLCLKACKPILKGQEIYTPYGNDYFFGEEYFHLRVPVFQKYLPSDTWLEALGHGWWSERASQLYGYDTSVPIPTVCTHVKCRDLCQDVRRRLDGKRTLYLPPEAAQDPTWRLEELRSQSRSHSNSFSGRDVSSFESHVNSVGPPIVRGGHRNFVCLFQTVSSEGVDCVRHGEV